MPPNRRRNILGNANNRPPPGPNRRLFPRPSPGWPPTGPPPATARTHRHAARAAPTFYAVARHPGYSSGSSRRLNPSFRRLYPSSRLAPESNAVAALAGPHQPPNSPSSPGATTVRRKPTDGIPAPQPVIPACAGI